MRPRLSASCPTLCEAPVVAASCGSIAPTHTIRSSFFNAPPTTNHHQGSHQGSRTKLFPTTTALALALTLVVSSSSVDAHPGQHHTHERSLHEIEHSRLFHANAHRTLTACANTDASHKLNEQAAARRLNKINTLRADRQRQRERQLRSEAAADVLATSHQSSLTGISPDTVTAATLFGTTPKCVLEPEVTQGPYYVNGELLRNDVRETQAGIDLYVELQIVDTTSCAVVADYYVDFWHCNTTGVYSGVVANGNGNSNDASNLNATFARGLYPTDDDGVVQFVTKFPGHYTGSTSHVHILGNHGGQVLANKTYAGGSVSSVGQLFFDQSLLTAVEATEAYAVNTQAITLNAADLILAEAAANGFDPVVQYVYLGDSVEDGVFAWISVGVDTTISESVSAAATLTATGGVANAGGVGGGGGGGPGSMGGPGMGPRPGSTDSSSMASSSPPTVDASSRSGSSASSVVTSSPATSTPSSTTSGAVSSGPLAVVGTVCVMAIAIFA